MPKIFIYPFLEQIYAISINTVSRQSILDIYITYNYTFWHIIFTKI